MTAPLDVTPSGLAKMCLGIIHKDQPRVQRIDRYVQGDHDGPYMPEKADDEYRKLAERAIMNMIPLLINSPAQALYVDSFRRGQGQPMDQWRSLPEWIHWQESRLDAKQLAIHRGALTYGHSFTLTELNPKFNKVITKGLSAQSTSAVYVDPANDIDPYAALTITRFPNSAAKTKAARLGAARLWDGINEYRVTFASLGDLDSVRVSRGFKHGHTECPVTRFAASVDLEGRTMGVVEPNIAVQDRINQTVFDLLVAQTYGSFKVRTVTGMAPPLMRWTQDWIDAGTTPYLGITPPEGTEAGDPVIDPHTGKAIPEPINLSAKRFLFAEDEKVRFGSLDSTSLEGYIKSLDMSIRHLAAMTQTPPHYLLGEIANLSAEALQTAETALLRKVEEYRKSFGESWERVFRLAAALNGDSAAAQDFSGEVLWRETTMRSLSQTADALVKLKELGIPMVGLWNRVPERTRGEIEEWFRQRDEDIAFRKQLAEIELIANQRIQIPEGQQPPTADELVPA